MEIRQIVMKASGLGLYGDTKALIAEAKKRVAQRRSKAD
jgi:hypothetical protein